ncbi:hypothetical protein Javan249_0020 [Streptococcus phage Javan249]|uniref:hypothetical protein n=1 Tax=Streptococcus halotolerans TaxID=1814128 RepID=UPI0007890784|nr:hypothetical protein [Streptococcus halotolerans]QBX16386.1 hypothetical protein Javan249_0020 [Streptococcus phage Javan249]
MHMIFKRKHLAKGAIVVDYQHQATTPRDYCDLLNQFELSDEEIAQKTGIDCRRVTRIRSYDLPYEDEMKQIERIFKHLR